MNIMKKWSQKINEITKFRFYNNLVIERNLNEKMESNRDLKRHNCKFTNIIKEETKNIAHYNEFVQSLIKWFLFDQYSFYLSCMNSICILGIKEFTSFLWNKNDLDFVFVFEKKSIIYRNNRLNLIQQIGIT